MKALIAAAAAAAVLAPLGARAADGEALLARMAAVNPTLHAYTATVHANVALRSFPFLTADLVGTLYHKDPDKTKVVFTSGMPAVASQFDKLYAHIEPPSRWAAVYRIAVKKDDGTTTQFELTPRKEGNVASVDATVDDATALVGSMRWNYKNGGYAEMHDRYGKVDGATVVTAQTGHVEEPGYAADITTSIDGYTLNPPLADGLFAE